MLLLSAAVKVKEICVGETIFVGSMCHTIERTDIQGYPNC
jgi:hypothetical protein